MYSGLTGNATGRYHEHMTNTTDSTDTRAIANARAIAGAISVSARRAYLRSVGSSYADDPDPEMVNAAVLGRAMDALEMLALRLEQEINRHA